MSNTVEKSRSRRGKCSALKVVAIMSLLAPTGVLGACSDSSSTGEHPTQRSAIHSASRYDGKSSCRSVVYVGESTSVGMVTPKQIPHADERLEARLKSVGVQSLRVDVSGGRSAIERLLGRPNTLDVLTPELTKSFKGCYFFALGVNDAANSSFAHSAGSAHDRIEAVLSRAGDRPVVWPLVATDSTLSGPYSDANMQRFNGELRAAAKRHPNLRLYDWPAEMKPSWREGDGIHDNRIGSRERALMYAHALSVAFPDGLPANSSTVVGSAWGKKPTHANAPALPAEENDNQSFWAGDTKALTRYTSGPEKP